MTAEKKPNKPNKDFPLFPHGSGQWAKKVKGRLTYFGSWRNDPKGVVALAKWLAERDELLAGQIPTGRSTDAPTVGVWLNRFLSKKEEMRQGGSLSPATYKKYEMVCDSIAEYFKRWRLLSAIRTSDIEGYRSWVGKQGWAPTTVDNWVRYSRVAFAYAKATDDLCPALNFAAAMYAPTARAIRDHRESLPAKKFEAAEIRELVLRARVEMKPLILLGINCGFGNSDCGLLKLMHLDLENGWLEMRRKKTGVQRRLPLWPETVAAIRASLAFTPARADGRVFSSPGGQEWASDDSSKNLLTEQFATLLDACNLRQPGRAFYALRHTFKTVGNKGRDKDAVKEMMGHAPRRDDMDAAYDEDPIDDTRLLATSNFIRGWYLSIAVDQKGGGASAA
jgi:integrase